MEKCDICGKKTLIPERLGNTVICKMCFMKMNGPVWKYVKFDKKETVEKQRSLALEAAKKQKYSDNILVAINNFFDEQESSMKVCDGCGNEVQNLISLGSSKLCKKCYSKINNSAWKQTDYYSNNEVEENRQKILNIAKNNNFSQLVIDDINDYFAHFFVEGLYAAVKGEDQKLIACEDYCELITFDSFDFEEMEQKYAKLLKKMKNNNSNFYSEGAKIAESLVSNLVFGNSISKGLVKAGVSLATSSIANESLENFVSSKERQTFNIKKGKTHINYDDYDIVELLNPYSISKDDTLGYIKFKKSGIPDDLNSEIFFFTSEETKKAQSIFSYISHKIDDEKLKQRNFAKNQQKYADISIADEILKFKQLLDMGAITEEEFEKKKKELLNL